MDKCNLFSVKAYTKVQNFKFGWKYQVWMTLGWKLDANCTIWNSIDMGTGNWLIHLNYLRSNFFRSICFKRLREDDFGYQWRCCSDSAAHCRWNLRMRLCTWRLTRWRQAGRTRMARFVRVVEWQMLSTCALARTTDWGELLELSWDLIQFGSCWTILWVGCHELIRLSVSESD